MRGRRLPGTAAGRGRWGALAGERGFRSGPPEGGSPAGWIGRRKTSNRQVDRKCKEKTWEEGERSHYFMARSDALTEPGSRHAALHPQSARDSSGSSGHKRNPGTERAWGAAATDPHVQVFGPALGGWPGRRPVGQCGRRAGACGRRGARAVQEEAPRVPQAAQRAPPDGPEVAAAGAGVGRELGWRCPGLIWVFRQKLSTLDSREFS